MTDHTNADAGGDEYRTDRSRRDERPDDADPAGRHRGDRGRGAVRDSGSGPASTPVRISLTNDEFEGQNNAYLFSDGDRAALVDTGIATRRTRRELDRELAEHGLSFADVAAVVVTHWHGDHAGLAGAVQAEAGATVYAHAADVPLIERDADEMAALEERARTRYEAWGIPDEKRAELKAFRERAKTKFREGADVTAVEDGDELAVGGTELTVVHLPGHTAGLIGLASDGGTGTELLSGDALLPVYTPNVGGADLRVERPLASYLDSLSRIVEGDYDRALPGHRDPIDDPTARALEIVDHHRERARRVLETLDRVGPADPWTVSAELFGELEGIHILHGPGEAYAHLQHLSNEGAVEADGGTYHLDGNPPDDPGILSGVEG